MKASVIMPAAGAASRFRPAADAPSKIDHPLAGKPVLLHAVDAFLHREDVAEVLIAVPPDQVEAYQSRYSDRLSWLGARIIAGGRVARWETVLTALREVDTGCTHIVVHDAARPLTSRALIDRVLTAANQYEAVIPAMPVSGTIKRVESNTEPSSGPDVGNDDTGAADPLDALLGETSATMPALHRIVETLPREGLMEAQTPQVFEASLLRRAYEPLESDAGSVAVTDDASLVEALGEAVYAVEGEPTNFKLTHPGEAELAEALLARRSTASDAEKKRKADDDEDEW